MASEPVRTRRRTNSTMSLGRPGHMRGMSRAVVVPKSTHTSDDFLKPFLNPSFDPAAFINSSLPPLQQRSTTASSGGSVEGSGVADLSSQAQALLSQLNAHTTRLSNTLTGLTDDILRSGSRLAYEVEVLRGETLSFSEAMNETLHDDIKKFIPEGLPVGDEPAAKKDASTAAGEGDQISSGAGRGVETDGSEPQHIKQLQMLTEVRSRLEQVIKTFGDAMEFVFPPSELSVSSSFLSVSAPEPGSQQQSSEEKGQQVLKQLRDEVSALLDGSEDPVEGIASAAQRVEQLKELTVVWRGTAEEKGRNKFIDSLAKMVEDRHKDLMREMEQVVKREGKLEAGRPRKSSVTRDAAVTEDSRILPGGFGLLNQLQRLRTGL